MTTPMLTLTHNAADDNFNVFNTIHEMIFGDTGHRVVQIFFDHLALLIAEDGSEKPIQLLIDMRNVNLTTIIYWIDRMTWWQQQQQHLHCTLALICDAAMLNTLLHTPVLKLLPAYADNAFLLCTPEQRDSAFEWLLGLWKNQSSVA